MNYGFWRKLFALMNCKRVGDSLSEWRGDMGYCLDRFISGDVK